MRLGVIGFVLATISSCGDPRSAFEGLFVGPATETRVFSNGRTERIVLGEIFVVVTAPTSSSSLWLDGLGCELTADVVAANRLRMQPRACPAVRIDAGVPLGASQPVLCDLVRTVASGEGTLTSGTLQLAVAGESQLSRCTDGDTGLWTFTGSGTLTRR